MRLVRAVGYLGEMEDGGRSRPLLLEVEQGPGSYTEVVVKLASDNASLGSKRLVREGAANAIADKLGLPALEPLAVEIGSDLINAIRISDPKIASRLEMHLRFAGTKAFGSTYLAGFGVFSPQSRLSADLLQCAAEIFAFDALTLNRDRCIPSGGNPNCLYDGKRLVMIDHEQALHADALLGDRSNAPWMRGSLNEMRGLLEHIFLASLSGRDFDLSRLERDWGSLDEAFIAEVLTKIPSEWDPEQLEKQGIRAYLHELGANLPTAFDEVRRVLA